MISFLIPVFNGQEYLSNAIASCVAQSLKTIEIIVVNDCSTDGTKRLIDWYASKDERIKAIHLDKNGGSGHARNVGVSAAKGNIICMLDADDESTRDRAKITNDLFGDSDNSLVYGSCVQLDCMGQNIGTLLASKFDIEDSLKKKLNDIVHSTMALPKSFLEKNPYDEDEFVRLGLEDWPLQLQAFKAGLEFKHTEKVLCGYRITRGSQSFGRDNKKVTELKEKFLSENQIIEKVIEEVAA